ncbi:hypothetical protein Droror1_Dr00005876 [Drosera rotundifolia]
MIHLLAQREASRTKVYCFSSQSQNQVAFTYVHKIHNNNRRPEYVLASESNSTCSRTTNCDSTIITISHQHFPLVENMINFDQCDYHFDFNQTTTGTLSQNEKNRSETDLQNFEDNVRRDDGNDEIVGLALESAPGGGGWEGDDGDGGGGGRRGRGERRSTPREEEYGVNSSNHQRTVATTVEARTVTTPMEVRTVVTVQVRTAASQEWLRRRRGRVWEIGINCRFVDIFFVQM